MKQFKKSFALVMLLTSMISSQTFAQHQDSFTLDAMLKFNKTLEVNALQANEKKLQRAREVLQDNECAFTGVEEGIFFSNSLMLDGKPLDFGDFNLLTRGELTVSKGIVTTGLLTQIPFYVYLKRNGNKVLIPGNEVVDSKQNKIDIAKILSHAQPGDSLVIEAVNKEDAAVKSILKVLGLGC